MMSGRRSNRKDFPRSSSSQDRLDGNGIDMGHNNRKSSRFPPPTQNPDAVKSNISVEATLSGGGISHGGNSRSQHVEAENSKINGKSNGTRENTPNGNVLSNGHHETKISSNENEEDVKFAADPRDPPTKKKYMSRANDSTTPMSQQQLYESVETLLRLDKSTYKETLMEDSDRVLDKMILPMSLPWTHLILNETRVVPRDIDELPAIYAEGKRSEGTMYEKINKAHQISADQRFRFVCSRLADPGVVEVKRFRQPTSLFLDDIDERRTCSKETRPPSTAKRLKIATFEEAISAKRRKLDVSSKPIQVKHISFRLGSTSSRANVIQSQSDSSTSPMLLEASFPDDVQKGKRVPLDQGRDIARQLGSYDLRFGLPNPSGHSTRVRSGRTRLVWSSKHIGGTRPVHHFIITGMAMESNDQKRPMTAKVSIKIGGRVLHCNRRSNRANQFVYSDQEIESALDRCLGEIDEESCSSASALVYLLEGRNDEGAIVPTPQCILDPAKVITSSRNAGDGVSQTAMIHRVTSKADANKSIMIVPPEIMSLPTEDGVVRTVCTKPGTLCTETKVADGVSTRSLRIEASSFLNDMAARAMACAVCWGSSEEKEDIVRCSSCDFRAHPSCHPGNKRQKCKADRTWKCNSCKNYYSNTNKKDATKKNGDEADSDSSVMTAPDGKHQCQLCNVEGGAISKFSSGWSHDVCQAWCPTGQEGQCDLCSESGKPVLRCAARGCSIKFHPMCAVVASRAAQHQQSTKRPSTQCEKCDGETDLKDEDAFLCTQYTFTTSSVTVGRGKGKDNTTHLVHLAFCGIHNSKRLPEFYGLNPGGLHYENAFSVPILPP